MFLGVLTNRLARIVDRARTRRESLREASRRRRPECARAQLRVAARRSRFINVSITLSTIAALLVALVVALLFASTFVPINLAGSVAVLFVLAMVGAGRRAAELPARGAGGDRGAAHRRSDPAATKKMTPGLWPGVE